MILVQASRGAWLSFGWRQADILDAVARLQVKHFYKREPYRENPSIEMDNYKARGLKGENVYTHFHVEDGLLIISSFKKIEEA